MELEDAIHTAMLALKENFEGEMNERNIQVAYVSNDTDHKIHILSPEKSRIIWRKWSNAIVCNKREKNK